MGASKNTATSSWAMIVCPYLQINRKACLLLSHRWQGEQLGDCGRQRRLQEGLICSAPCAALPRTHVRHLSGPLQQAGQGSGSLPARLSSSIANAMIAHAPVLPHWLACHELPEGDSFSKIFLSIPLSARTSPWGPLTETIRERLSFSSISPIPERKNTWN